jgi:hypothetical protein
MRVLGGAAERCWSSRWWYRESVTVQVRRLFARDVWFPKDYVTAKYAPTNRSGAHPRSFAAETGRLPSGDIPAEHQQGRHSEDEGRDE